MICIFGLISSPLSSYWLTRAVVFAAVASFGGILVLVGLWMENGVEKDWFRNADDFMRQKWKAKIGWRVLMFGILVEIGTGAGLTWYGVKENMQTANQIEKNNPLNQPVSDISAWMIIKLKGTNFIEGPSPISSCIVRGSLINLGGNGRGVLNPSINPGGVLSFLKVTNLGGGIACVVDDGIVSILGASGYATSQFGVLESDGFRPFSYSDETNHGYILYFHTVADESLRENENYGTRRPTAGEVISNASWLKIWCEFIPKNAEVIDGSAEISINSSFPMEFQILPKNGETIASPDGFGFGLIATNTFLRKNPSSMQNVFPIRNGIVVSPSNMPIHRTIRLRP